MKNSTGFMGTYFDRDAVLRLTRWVRGIGWAVLAIYIIEAGWNSYNWFINISANNFPFDPYFVIQTVSKLGIGALLFIILQALAQLMLILLDIEDNTRRAARGNSKEN